VKHVLAGVKRRVFIGPVAKLWRLAFEDLKRKLWNAFACTPMISRPGGRWPVRFCGIAIKAQR